MTYTIEPAREEDLAELTALYLDYFDQLCDVGMNYELSREDLPEVLRGRIRSRLILAALARTAEGTPAGFVFCSFLRISREYRCCGESFIGYINDIYTVPAARREGLAARLFRYAEDWLRAQGVTAVEAQILSENRASLAFFSKLGLKPVNTTYFKTIEQERKEPHD